MSRRKVAQPTACTGRLAPPLSAFPFWVLNPARAADDLRQVVCGGAQRAVGPDQQIEKDRACGGLDVGVSAAC